MKRVLVLILLLGFVAEARAELGLGVIGRYHIADNYSLSSDTPGESVTAQSGYSFGAMVFLPILPWFSARLGFDIEQMKIADSIAGAPSVDNVTNQNLLIPLDLQFDIPAVDLYAFVGLIPELNINGSSSLPGQHYATRPDVRFDLGLGYSFVAIGPVKLSVELEYMKGLFNVSPNPSSTLRTESFTGNLLARFTL